LAGREDRILMRNAYADFGVSVYAGLVAVWIVERDDGAYWDADWRTARSPRAQRWLSQIASRFEALFGDYVCLGHMSNGEGRLRKTGSLMRQSLWSWRSALSSLTKLAFALMV
jgi:hypothetical protein